LGENLSRNFISGESPRHELSQDPVTEVLCHALGVDGSIGSERSRLVDAAIGYESVQMRVEVQRLTSRLHGED
jgi:hypothetical protein